MLEQIQRDLFALGARLADPAKKIADRVDQGGGDATRTSAGSRDGSIGSRRNCRRCAGSSSPADREPAPRCTSRERSAAAPSARIVALGRDTVEPELLVYMNRLSDLLFVMARAANHRAGAAKPNGSGRLDDQEQGAAPGSARSDGFAR